MFKRGFLLLIVSIVLWQILVWVFQLPDYILPTPGEVLKTWVQQVPLIASQTWPTMIEALAGLLLSIFFGSFAALSMMLVQPVRYWLMPLLLLSQAIPTFAIAPLLVIWFGYGMMAKIMTTLLVLFFPVASAFYDGLRRTDAGWLDLAKVMQGTRLRILWHIQVPAGLPGLATGVRVATAGAPLGAVIGEWVGSSRGLGFLMLNANARMQISLLFAALFTLMVFSLILYLLVDKFLKKIIAWQVEK